jgi:CHAT domain-containing protein/tetratricopeptide (TPR) repeat protein
MIKKTTLGTLLFVLTLGLSACENQARSQAAGATSLASGKTLSGGESHTYELSLKAGQFVRFAVTQHHIDTLLALTGPDGKALSESDSLSGYEGTEKLSWVAEAAGAYKLAVRSPDKYSSPGTYDLKLEELRPSKAGDPTRVRAERLWMDSLKLYQNGSFQAASNNLKELLAAWDQLGDPAGKADTLEMKASIDLQRGVLDSALRDFKSVVELRRQLGDGYGQASALYLSSRCQIGLRQLPAALDDLQKAEAISVPLDDELEQSRFLGEIGVVQWALGQKDNADRVLDQSWKMLFRASPHTRAIAPTLQIADTLQASGNSKAMHFYYYAEDFAKKINLTDAYHYDPKTTSEQRRPMGVLAEGKPVTGILLGGESHAYTLPLKAKQFVRLAVAQRHIDTTQVLYGPDGVQLAESDTLSESEGTERISWVAENAGNYTLEVRSPDKYVSPGAYELKIEELRASQAADRTRVQAERLWMDSLKLYQKQTEPSLRTATGNVTELLATWKQLGDLTGQADALELRAGIEFQHGALDAALLDYNSVIDLRHQLGDRYREIAALYLAGLCYVRSSKLQNAAENLQKALTISVSLGDELEQAKLAAQIGGFQDLLGSKDAAKQTYENSLRLYRRAQPQTKAIAPLLGFTEGLLTQRNPIANQFAQIALNIARRFRDRPNEGRAALLHGRALELLRQYNDSLTDYHEAEQSFLETTDERNRAAALAGHGRICALVGDYACAQDWLPQAIKVQQATNDSAGMLETSTILAEVLNSVGQETAALKMLGDLLKLPDAQRDKSAQARILNAMGVSQTHMRQYEPARSSLERALALRKESRDRSGEGTTLSDLGQLYSEMGRLDQGLDALKQALQAFSEVKDRLGAALAQQRGGNVQRKQKNYNAAVESLILSVDNFEDERTASGLGVENMQGLGNMQIVFFSDRVASAENDLASLLAEMATVGKYPIPKRLQGANDDFANLAFYFSERGRSLELNGIMSGAREGGIVRTSVETIQAKNIPLHDHEILVEYLVEPEQTLMWIVSRKGAPAKMLKIPVGREQLSSLIQQARPNPTKDVRALIDEDAADAAEATRPQASSDSYRKVLARLYDLLLAPVLKDAPPQTSILIIPDGPLQLIPFEMLGHGTPRGWRWAGSDHVFREYNSALVLALWRLDEMGPQGSTFGQQPKPSTEQKLLAFGDPDYSGTSGATSPDRGRTRSAFERAGYKLPPLPGTRVEVTGIAKIFGLPSGSPDVKLGPSANKAVLKQLNKSEELKHYRYLHFATHGILANDVPGVGQPALVLSQTGSDSEGFLTMKEVQGLRIRADLVVLSACQTGLGKQIAGEGTMGMSRAFIIAGAPSVVVSLWSVPDESTAKLMQLFYTHLIKEHRDKGVALQMAREELRKQYPNPFFWAPFILIGEK